MPNLKENLAFVLVRTHFASNLGSTVRVMKNMGLERLILVQPQCEVGIEARSFAMRGAEILDHAEFLPSLEAVASQLGVLIGTTGRFQGTKTRLIDCPTLVREVLPELTSTKVGLVFGSEDNGLWREELRLCQWLVEIPTARSYPILNLAQAAAIVAYQIHLGSETVTERKGPAKADAAQLASLLDQTESTLEQLALPTRISIPRLMNRLRKVAGRAQLEREDVNMFHGLLREIRRRNEQRQL